MSGQDTRTLNVTARRCGLVAVLIAFAIMPLANAVDRVSSDMRPDQIFWLLQKRVSASLKNVDKYVERIQGAEIPGLRAGLAPGQSGACLSDCRVYTTVDVPLADGTVLNAGYLLSPSEVAVLAGQSPAATTLEVFGGAYGAMQDMFANNADEMTGPFSGLARAAFGDISVSNSQVREDIENTDWHSSHPEDHQDARAPWLNPFRLFGAGSYMFYETAKGVKEAELGLQQSTSKALADAERQRELLANAEVVGFEDVDGTRAVHIALPAGTTGPAQNFDDQQFVPTGASVWIDTDRLAILKHRVDGTVTADGQTREMFIESERSDFRDVPGSDMYEPYRRVMRMGGVMDEAQMAQMEKAKLQLAEFDRKMAAMPASQRAMVENMMGGQMDALRGMTESGTIEYVEVIKEILVNPDIRALYAAAPAGAGSLLPMSAIGLLAGIQADLLTLGYQPGNTNGVADAMTTVAISQFQAEHDLEVTGQPSQALATTLANLVAQ